MLVCFFVTVTASAWSSPEGPDSRTHQMAQVISHAFRALRLCEKGGTQTCPLFLFAGVVSPGMANSPNDDLFPDARNPKGTHVINERCRHITRDGHRVVLVSGIPIAQ